MDGDTAPAPSPSHSRGRSSSLYINEGRSPAPSPSLSPSPSSRRERRRQEQQEKQQHQDGSSGSGSSSSSSSSSRKLPRSGSSSGRRQRQPGGLSQKTLSIVNTLPQPPPARAGKEEEDEEERRLALEEKRRHQQQRAALLCPQPTAASAGAGAEAAAVGGSGAPVAVAGAGVTASGSLPPGGEYTDYMSIRILLLGDSGVGKTSLMMRYSEDQFAPCLLSTAGVDFKVRHLTLEESRRRVKVQIWDTAGQERMHVITRTYYKGSHGIALVYNLADPDSFRNVNYWMANIQQHAGDKVVKILIGNKSDLPDRSIAPADGAALAKEFGFHLFYETSAKTGEHVQAAFDTLALDIVRKLEAQAQSEAAAAAAAAAQQGGQGAGGGGKGGKGAGKKDCVVS